MLLQEFRDGKNMQVMQLANTKKPQKRKKSRTPRQPVQHVGTKLWPFIVDFLVVTVVVRACVSVCK